MSDPRFVEAVRNVKHDRFCDALHKLTNGGVLGSCDCTRDARIAEGIRAIVEIECWEPDCECWRDKLAAFTSASAPKEGA